MAAFFDISYNAYSITLLYENQISIKSHEEVKMNYCRIMNKECA